MAEGRLGTTIGEYRLDRLLGSGGFGSVWQATHVTTGAVVAVKLLTGTYSTGDLARQRADIELLAAAASAASEHVVRVLSGGVEPTPYIVMEFIDGVNLASLLRERGRLTVREALDVGLAVVDALAALNVAGIIHRDVKPANVMIDRAGIVKLTDFGIAKIVGYDSVTATGTMPLSMAYAAPEVWEGHPSHQSDVYALGVLLYECLTGGPPFKGTPPELYRQHAAAEPDLQTLPAERPPSLVQLLARCMAKDMGQRLASADECRVLLNQAVAELDAARAGDGQPEEPGEPARFGPWLIRAPRAERAWSWECVHESSGETAVVELQASDDIGLGQQLRDAVDANPALVAFGAERLLGTNRLLLRPGERWLSAPAGQFQFWVAREVTPLPATSPNVTRDVLLRAAASLAAMIDLARAVDLRLSLVPETLGLLPDGRVLVQRPGLPPTSSEDAAEAALSWLRTLSVSAEDAALLVGVSGLAALTQVAHGGTATVEAPRASFGVAQVAADRREAPATTEQTDLVAIRRMGRPLLADVPKLVVPELQTPKIVTPAPLRRQEATANETPAVAQSTPHERAWLWPTRLLLVAVVGALVMVVMLAFPGPGGHPEGGSAQGNVAGTRSTATPATASSTATLGSTVISSPSIAGGGNAITSPATATPTVRAAAVVPAPPPPTAQPSQAAASTPPALTSNWSKSATRELIFVGRTTYEYHLPGQDRNEYPKGIGYEYLFRVSGVDLTEMYLSFCTEQCRKPQGTVDLFRNNADMFSNHAKGNSDSYSWSYQPYGQPELSLLKIGIYNSQGGSPGPTGTYTLRITLPDGQLLVADVPHTP